MPITKTMAFKVGDKTYATVEEAQIVAIAEALKDSGPPISTDDPLRELIAAKILNHAEEIVDILDSDPESEKKPRKPRSDKGTKRVKEFTAEEVK